MYRPNWLLKPTNNYPWNVLLLLDQCPNQNENESCSLNTHQEQLEPRCETKWWCHPRPHITLTVWHSPPSRTIPDWFGPPRIWRYTLFHVKDQNCWVCANEMHLLKYSLILLLFGHIWENFSPIYCKKMYTCGMRLQVRANSAATALIFTNSNWSRIQNKYRVPQKKLPFVKIGCGKYYCW